MTTEGILYFPRVVQVLAPGFRLSFARFLPCKIFSYFNIFFVLVQKYSATFENRSIIEQSLPSYLGQAPVEKGDEGGDKERNADSKEESGIDQKLNLENINLFLKEVSGHEID